MKTISASSRRIFRKILGGISLGSALFVFQACYGMPSERMFYLDGAVTSESSKEPIEGIKVKLNIGEQYPQSTYTDANGNFSFHFNLFGEASLSFTDVDSTENGNYIGKDTLITLNESVRDLKVELQKAVEEEVEKQDSTDLSGSVRL